MIELGIIPQPTTSSLTRRRFNDFAAAWIEREEYRQWTEREQERRERARERRAAEDIHIDDMMVILAFVFPPSQFANCVFSSVTCPAQCLKKRNIQILCH